jgi:hypothetical protein
MRVAVVGLYDSGSTCVAGILHRLGVDMGAPYWQNSSNNFYEPYDLSCSLRHFWREPYGDERTPDTTRIEILRNWVLMREALGNSNIGAKHPLLSLSLKDMLTAWGEETKFIWCYRSLDESISQLKQRKWFGSRTKQLQKKLWESLESFNSDHPLKFKKIEFHEMRREREKTVNDVVNFLGISPQSFQIANAITWIRPEYNDV